MNRDGRPGRQSVPRARPSPGCSIEHPYRTDHHFSDGRRSQRGGADRRGSSPLDVRGIADFVPTMRARPGVPERADGLSGARSFIEGDGPEPWCVYVGSGPLPGALLFAHLSGTWRAPGGGSRDAGRSEAKDSNFLSPRVQRVNPCWPPSHAETGASLGRPGWERSRDGLVGFDDGPEPRGSRATACASGSHRPARGTTRPVSADVVVPMRWWSTSWSLPVCGVGH